jgi:hypothetical protein
VEYIHFTRLPANRSHKNPRRAIVQAIAALSRPGRRLDMTNAHCDLISQQKGSSGPSLFRLSLRCTAVIRHHSPQRTRSANHYKLAHQIAHQVPLSIKNCSCPHHLSCRRQPFDIVNLEAISIVTHTGFIYCTTTMKIFKNIKGYWQRVQHSQRPDVGITTPSATDQNSVQHTSQTGTGGKIHRSLRTSDRPSGGRAQPPRFPL